jgi:hypothetical protein
MKMAQDVPMVNKLDYSNSEAVSDSPNAVACGLKGNV